MRIDRLETRVYRLPTDLPEADGTIHWDSTTLVLVEAVTRCLGVTPVGGCLRPDPERPGFGRELKEADAARFRVC